MPTYIDPALKPMLDDFTAEAVKHGRTVGTEGLSMKFGTFPRTPNEYTIGMCDDGDGEELVTIDQQFWNESNFYDREQLVFHELGHCLLGRDHCNVEDNGLPISIMNAYHNNVTDYTQRRDALVQELFHADPRCP